MIRDRIRAIALISALAMSVALPWPGIGGHVPNSEAAAVDKCTVCGKAVYAQDEVMFNQHAYHRACFKCSYDGCGVQLNLQTAKMVNGRLYCARHAPKAKS